MKKFFKEFKAFVSRGNVLDLAVGMIIGAAFTSIVTAFTNNIIRPLINFVIKLIIGDTEIAAYSFLSKVYKVDETTGAATKVIDMDQSIYIDWGSFISAIINFVLVALVLFFIVKAFNAAKNSAQILTDVKVKKEKGLKLTKKEQKILAKLEAEEKERLALEQEAKRLAEIEANKPTKEELLLTEIRDLLAKK